jgi:hypothetical protein
LTARQFSKSNERRRQSLALSPQHPSFFAIMENSAFLRKLPAVPVVSQKKMRDLCASRMMWYLLGATLIVWEYSVVLIMGGK